MDIVTLAVWVVLAWTDSFAIREHRAPSEVCTIVLRSAGTPDLDVACSAGTVPIVRRVPSRVGDETARVQVDF